MPNEELEQLREQVASLQEDIRKLKEHQHLGIDGSSLLLGNTPILAESLGLVGSTIRRGDYFFAPFSIVDGQLSNANVDVDANQNIVKVDTKQRTAGIGLAVAGIKDTSGEQINTLFSAGIAPDLEEVNKPTNVTDWTKVNFSSLGLIHSPANVPTPSGPSFLSRQAFLEGKRTPEIRNSTGTIVAGGSTLVDSTANFIGSSVLLTICNIRNTNGTILASYRVIGHTSNVLTLGTVFSNGAAIPASLPVSGNYSYQLRSPMLLGSAGVPWERLYVGEDIRLGYGGSDGSQVRYIKWGPTSPEGLIPANTGSIYYRQDVPGMYVKGANKVSSGAEVPGTGWAGILTGNGSPQNVVVANIGTIYLRQDGGTTTTLYVKTSGNGSASGWTAK